MKRYDKVDDTGSGYSDMREAPAGEWVRHEDIMPFIASVLAYKPVPALQDTPPPPADEAEHIESDKEDTYPSFMTWVRSLM